MCASRSRIRWASAGTTAPSSFAASRSSVRQPPPRDPARRAVVTGLGAISPIGNDVETFWSSLTAGVSGVGPITLFDASDLEVRIAAEVKGFETRDWIDFKQARRMSRFAQIAVAGARQAIDSSGLE